MAGEREMTGEWEGGERRRIRNEGRRKGRRGVEREGKGRERTRMQGR